MTIAIRELIDADGRLFLADRGLNPSVAEVMGVTSENGEICFPFMLNGQVVRKKFRSLTDKKKQRMDSSTDKSLKTPFWNQRNWATSDYLIITEGEFDCIALTQLGACKCVSLPNGASCVKSVFESQFEYLQKFDVIYIAFDMDEAGTKAAEEARKILPIDKFRRIHFPAKDANEWIKEKNPVTFDDLQHLMRNAERNECESVIELKSLPETWRSRVSIGCSTGWFDVDEILGGIRPGEMTVISGDTGAGKTTFCINLLCNLVNGKKQSFWVNSWEMHYQTIIRKIAGVILGTKFKTEEFKDGQYLRFKSWLNDHNILINPKKTKADVETIRNQIELASKLYGVKYVMLDHLDYITDTSMQREGHEKIKETVSKIQQMALDFDVHIFLVAHGKQTDDSSGKMHMGMLKGGASIKQYADNIILLQNMNQADITVRDNRVLVRIDKNRFLGKRGVATLRYISESDSYVENSEIFKPTGEDHDRDNEY